MSRWLMTEDKTKIINSDDVKIIFVTENNEIMVKSFSDELRVMAKYDDRETAMEVLLNYMRSNTVNFMFVSQSEVEGIRYSYNQLNNNMNNNNMNVNTSWSTMKGPFRR